ncbi:MAG: PEP-CTERM sorting domain-containing protein [Opitutaceae bacterium]|nr:PEP-CTERM sorting domain-containing protein [Opitutaceae bacterium]
MKRITAALLASGTLLVASLQAQSTLFSQDWANTALITVNDDWSGLWNGTTGTGIVGFRGDSLTGSAGTDPQTLTSDDASPLLDVNANQTNPNTFMTGGLAEFDALTNPTIALTGSGTADAPYLLFGLSTLGYQSINVSYTLRDIDGSTDNAVQSVALQFRTGSTGTWANLAAGFVADASTGPSLAAQETAVSVADDAFSNLSLVQFRVITTNAVGNDEWIGVDDIRVTGAVIPEPSTYAMILGALALGLVAVRRFRR